MDITRRAVIPLPVALATLGGVKAAEAASPYKIIATADGPYRSRIVEIDGAPIKPVVPPTARGELNQDPYILLIG